MTGALAVATTIWSLPVPAKLTAGMIVATTPAPKTKVRKRLMSHLHMNVVATTSAKPGLPKNGLRTCRPDLLEDSTPRPSALHGTRMCKKLAKSYQREGADPTRKQKGFAWNRF
jgi:hypothetical protein